MDKYFCTIVINTKFWQYVEKVALKKLAHVSK